MKKWQNIFKSDENYRSIDPRNLMEPRTQKNVKAAREKRLYMHRGRNMKMEEYFFLEKMHENTSEQRL